MAERCSNVRYLTVAIERRWHPVVNLTHAPKTIRDDLERRGLTKPSTTGVNRSMPLYILNLPPQETKESAELVIDCAMEIIFVGHRDLQDPPRHPNDLNEMKQNLKGLTLAEFIRDVGGVWRKTPEEEARLRVIYDALPVENKALSKVELDSLATELGKPASDIRAWFNTERRRVRREATARGEDADEHAAMINPGFNLFRADQVHLLMAEFAISPKADRARLGALITATGLSETQILRWFERQGARARREAAAKGEDADSDLAVRPYKKFRADQTAMLMAAFNTSPRADSVRMKALITDTGLSKMQIRNWFADQRRRAARVEDAGAKRQRLVEPVQGRGQHNMLQISDSDDDDFVL